MTSPPREQLEQIVAFYRAGRFAELLPAAEKLAATYPDTALLHDLLGAANMGLGRFEAAIDNLTRALELKPEDAAAHSNLGVAYAEQGAFDDAISCFRRALEIDPGHVDANVDLAAAYSEKGEVDDAIASYRRAIELDPRHARAHNNLGLTLDENYAREEAIACFREALRLEPDYADAHSNLGVALSESGATGEAIDHLERAVKIDPDHAPAHNNLATALKAAGAMEEAIASFERLLQLDPDDESARARKLHLQAVICDWPGLAADAAVVPKLGVGHQSVPPFDMLFIEDSPARHLLRSERQSAVYDLGPRPLPPPPPVAPARLRIGYFSSGFRNHPLMYLMAKLFAIHDRERFEIFAYSFGPDRRDEMRDYLEKTVDVFRDVRHLTDEAAADLAREDGIDIAVDRNGHTTYARPGIFANRAAPVQISYLAYPGTTGAPFIDYLIADDVVIPAESRQFYSEQIIYLPHSYFASDDSRKISERAMTRAMFGLPADAFVFCCFNNTYKLGPREFDIWMRLLSRVKGSVLWLFKANQWVEGNLVAEARKRGIAPERLIFAERLPVAEHLARHRLADLSLDTFNYNAHTTASDALWTGLPLVTKLGQGFAARVGASLLGAVGLPELITETEEAYEQLALELATDPRKLASIKEKLAYNRMREPLFNTALFASHLEAAYRQAYQRYFEGKAPEMFRIEA